MGWTKRWRKRLRALVRRDAVERELSEELAHHLEMETQKNLRAGMSPAEARRRAVLAFGGVEKYREEVREGWTLAWLGGLSLDLRLGFRMLRKHPGLTVVGSFAIAFAIWVGVGTFEFVFQVVSPTLPFDDGDRVVGIRTWDAASSDMRATGLHDFATWKDELRSVDDLGAYRTVERNLITPDGRSEPIRIAEISASAFDVTRVPALVGRTLTAADEEPGAAPVVGVMPEDFGFPVAHGVWIPLRLNALAHARGTGPTVEVFGRLAPRASMDAARAELVAIGARTAADHPETHQHLRPRVMPYPKTILDPGGLMSLGLLSINGFIAGLLVLLCGNVALLMFARAASREGEIVVRNALGASRGRIVVQMFAEALVLASLAGMIGLALARYGLRWGMAILEAEIVGGALPFWFHDGLSPASVVYAVVLTLLAAAIAGVLPGLKMTGEGLAGRLREGGARGGGPRFGGVWTAVIVSQVALTVLFPLLTFEVQRDMKRTVEQGVGFAAERYLSVRLEMDPEAPASSGDGARAAHLAHLRSTQQELERRLLEQPAVAGVTFASNVPRRYHDWNQVEMDGGAVVPLDTVRGHRVSDARVAPDYFEVLGTGLLSGRGFHSGDVESGARVAIANERFVEQVLGGRNAVGRRVRYVASDVRGDLSRSDEPWYEIVGVAPDLGMTSGYGAAGLYHPILPDAASSLFMVVRLRGEPEAFTPALRRLAAEVDPTLRLHDVLPLDRMDAAEAEFYDFWLRLTALLTLVVLTLSWAGIYAVISFTVSRRTREIGIRVALGGDARRVVLEILRRPLAQVTLGVALGAIAILALRSALSDPGMGPSPGDVVTMVAYAAVMLGVCLLACVVPIRRALGVEPTEALRVD